MIAKSIRWRFVLWLAFLLIGILIGFGVTAYQLNRINRFRQIDEELGAAGGRAEWRCAGAATIHGPPTA